MVYQLLIKLCEFNYCKHRPDFNIKFIYRGLAVIWCAQKTNLQILAQADIIIKVVYRGLLVNWCAQRSQGLQLG